MSLSDHLPGNVKLMLSIIIVVSVLAVILNVYAMIVLFINRRNNSYTRVCLNICLYSLVVTGCLSGIFFVCDVIVYLKELKFADTLMVISRHFLLWNNIVHILVLTLERGFAVIYPLHHRSTSRKSVMMCSIVAIWLVSIIVGVSFVGYTNYYLLTFSITIICLGLILIIVYVSIFRTISKHSRFRMINSVPMLNPTDNQSPTVSRQQRRLCVMCAMICLGYIVSNIPTAAFVISKFPHVGEDDSPYKEASMNVLFSFVGLISISIMNPLIYVLSDKKLKKCIRV